MKIVLKYNFGETNSNWFIKRVNGDYLYIETETKFTCRIHLGNIVNLHEIDFTNKKDKLIFIYDEKRSFIN